MARCIKVTMQLVLIAAVITISACKKEQVTLLTQEVDSHTIHRLNDVIFVNDSVGYICGGEEYSIGILQHSTDGGRTWTIPDSIFNAAAYTMQFFNAAEGVIAGNVSDWAYTADSGKTFNASQSDYHPINAIAFADRQHGVKVGGGGYLNGTIGYSSDGGQTWIDTTLPNALTCVAFIDNNTAYASGYGVIYKSIDGGRNFGPLEVRGDFYISFCFVNSTTGYFAGHEGEILKTSDAGTSFIKVRKGNAPFGRRVNFNAIKFFDQNNGAVVGDNGIMYVTNDGGGNWKLAKQFTGVNLKAVYLFSANSGIVVGDNGKVFLFQE